jgi:hypothetical protein
MQKQHFAFFSFYFSDRNRIMQKQHFAFAAIIIFLWTLMIMFGSILFETFIIYPNVFRDVPGSFEAAAKFMAVAGPSNFFRPIGAATIPMGIASLLLSWRTRQSFYWLLGSLIVIIIGEFLFSALFFWPRNTVMFVEGTRLHSAATLQQVAWEFQTGHWFRLALSTCSAALAFIGLLKFYRFGILTRDARRESVATAVATS